MTPIEKEKERNRLHKLYWQRDKEFEAAKGKRTILTILGFAVIYFLVICSAGKPTGFDIVLALISALVMAGIHFFINASIFLYLFQKGNEEAKRLESIQKQIDELE